MWNKYKEKLANNSEIYLRIKVVPGAHRSEIREKMADETIKIAISAPPEKGRANEELIKFLAKELAIGKKNVRIISGAGDRLKLIKITK